MFLRTLITSGAIVGCVSVALGDDWAGLYQAIDAVDGSIDTMAIMPVGDGTYDIRTTSTGFGLCGDDPSPGFLTATGHVEDGSLIRKNVRFSCIGNDKTGELDDGAAYEPNEEVDVLTIKGPYDRVNHYYRID